MNLIFDRTIKDINNETDKAFIDYKDLNRIKDALQELGVRATSIGYTLEPTFTKEWLLSDIRSAEEVAKLKADLLKVRNLIAVTPNMPKVPSTPFMDYKTANDTEFIIYLVNEIAEGIIKTARYSGEIYAGED